MLKHVPLHFNALERSPGLETWLMDSLSWSETKWAILKPDDWFDKAHRDTNLIWVPPRGRLSSNYAKPNILTPTTQTSSYARR